MYENIQVGIIGYGNVGKQLHSMLLETGFDKEGIYIFADDFAADETGRVYGFKEYKLEKFYDLHCTMEGSDVIVSKPVFDCNNIRTAYNEEADYVLYNEAPDESVTVPANNYCLIPPADAHMALYGECGFVRKLVFKIPVSV